MHLYSSAGTYTVTLTADEYRSSDTEEGKDGVRARVYRGHDRTGRGRRRAPPCRSGRSRRYTFNVNQVTNGLSGSNVSVVLSAPSIGEISGVTIPAWAVLNTTSALPADTFWFGGVDIGQQVQGEVANVLLGEIAVRADAVGTTTLSVRG